MVSRSLNRRTRGRKPRRHRAPWRADLVHGLDPGAVLTVESLTWADNHTGGTRLCLP